MVLGSAASLASHLRATLESVALSTAGTRSFHFPTSLVEYVAKSFNHAVQRRKARATWQIFFGCGHTGSLFGYGYCVVDTGVASLRRMLRCQLRPQSIVRSSPVRCMQISTTNNVIVQHVLFFVSVCLFL